MDYGIFQNNCNFFFVVVQMPRVIGIGSKKTMSNKNPQGTNLMNRQDIYDEHDLFLLKGYFAELEEVVCLLSSLIILQGLVFRQLIYLETHFFCFL